MDESELFVPAPNPDRYTDIGRVGSVPNVWSCRHCGCLVANPAVHDQIPHPLATVPPR